MSNPPQPPTDAERFIAKLNRLDVVPTWNEAAELGVPLVDLSREELAVRGTLADLNQAAQGPDAAADSELATALEADIADYQARLEQIEFRPGRYFLASGEVVEYNAADNAHTAGVWHQGDVHRVATPQGERVHLPGIHPAASIDPRAQIDPTVRIEAGATIGPAARIGPYSHIGRDAAIGPNTLVQAGTWVGSSAQVWPNSCVGQGAAIGPNSTIGHHTSVGSGAQITAGTTIHPYSRLGAGTTVSTTPARKQNPRGAGIANAIENLMRYDHE